MNGLKLCLLFMKNIMNLILMTVPLQSYIHKFEQMLAPLPESVYADLFDCFA